jgi:uncharacterized protein YqeY
LRENAMPGRALATASLAAAPFSGRSLSARVRGIGGAPGGRAAASLFGSWRMLRDQFKEALKDAMKARNERAVGTLRLIQAALKDRDIAARGRGNMNGIDEAEILSMLQGMIKQRRESIEQFEKGGRSELARAEQEEIAVIERYLPKQMSDADAEAAIKALIAELGAASIKDMGRTMAALKERFAGKMDMTKASAMVKQALTK